MSLFGAAALLSLYIFASSDEIDDWCKYVDPGNVESEIIGKRSYAWRYSLLNALAAINLCVFLTLGFSKDLKAEATGIKGRLSKFAYMFHKFMRTEEDCSIAPVYRSSLFFFSLLGIGKALVFNYYATKVVNNERVETSGENSNQWVTKAESAYSIWFSLWAIQYFSVGLFYFSRPKSKDKLKYFVYALLPLSSFLSARGCWLMHKWEVKEDAGLYNQIIPVTRFESGFYNNIGIGSLSVVLLPLVWSSKRLLETSSNEAVNGHLVLLSTQMTSVVAPALFLCAESVGCVHSRSYRECYALLEANFTGEGVASREERATSCLNSSLRSSQSRSS